MNDLTVWNESEPDLFVDKASDSHKDVRELMEFPFFSIQKTPCFEPKIYNDGRVSIEVQPGHRGMATIWDKDLILYVTGIINRAIEDGNAPPTKVRFTPYDFLKRTRRSTGSKAYKDLGDTLNRLQSTSIRTNIVSGDERLEDRGFFSWIKSGRLISRRISGRKLVPVYVEVEIEDWLWRLIAEDRSVLTINQEYFSITSGVARRLYELARKHVGRQPRWVISFRRLLDKVGASAVSPRNFKRSLADVISAADLPEYDLCFAAQRGEVLLTLEEAASTRSDRLFIVFTRKGQLRLPASTKSRAKRLTEKQALASPEYKKLVKEVVDATTRSMKASDLDL